MSDIEKLLRQMNKTHKQFSEVYTAYKNYEFSLIAESAESDDSELDEAECEMFSQEDTALKEQFAGKIRGLQGACTTLLDVMGNID